MIKIQKIPYSEATEGTARFWIVQHIPDLFRQESRNVGVIVESGGVFDGKFLGETGGPASFDNRSLRSFEYPKVFRNWVRYWRRLLNQPKHLVIEALQSQTEGNFRVIDGGIIDRTGSDSLASVRDYTYAMLVSTGGLSEALQLGEDPEDTAAPLRNVIAKSFRDLGLLGGTADLFGRHPIIANQPLAGARTVHTFSFIQRHGSMDVIEPLNFSTPQKVRVRERAGWMANAFEDIRATGRSGGFNAFVIVEDPDLKDDTTKYCLDMVYGRAEIVDWTETGARKRFLQSRQEAFN